MLRFSCTSGWPGQYEGSAATSRSASWSRRERWARRRSCGTGLAALGRIRKHISTFMGSSACSALADLVDAAVDPWMVKKLRLITKSFSAVCLSKRGVTRTTFKKEMRRLAGLSQPVKFLDVASSF